LLHLLSSIHHLPVTRSIVKDSGLGKKVGVLPKHKSYAGTPNESAIEERVQTIKDSWKNSVKIYKDDEAEQPSKQPEEKGKRPATDSEVSVKPPSKKTKVETTKASKSSFSSLLKKASGDSTNGGSNRNNTSSTNSVPSSNDPMLTKTSKELLQTSAEASSPQGNAATTKRQSKKSTKRVKWADHFGKTLTAAKDEDGVETAEIEHHADSSWNDRKMRDRLKEKELLAKVK